MYEVDELDGKMACSIIHKIYKKFKALWDETEDYGCADQHNTFGYVWYHVFLESKPFSNWKKIFW